jgi:hypothetical protein
MRAGFGSAPVDQRLPFARKGDFPLGDVRELILPESRRED